MALEWKQALENRSRMSTSSANGAIKRLKPHPYTITSRAATLFSRMEKKKNK